MCKNEKRTHGTAARSPPVAHLLASEARHARTSGHARSAYNDPSLCLFPGDRSRESCGTWQLPQIILFCVNNDDYEPDYDDRHDGSEDGDNDRAYEDDVSTHGEHKAAVS